MIFSHERISISVGPCIQKRSQQIRNAKVSVSYQLTGTKKDIDELEIFESEEIDFLQLRAFGYVNYMHQNCLSYNAAMLEATAQVMNNNDWNSAKFSTLESGVGFELHVMLKKIHIRNYIATSIYYRLNHIEGMYSDKYGNVLTLGTGIIIPSFKKPSTWNKSENQKSRTVLPNY